MSQLLAFIFTGLVAGALYAIMASGLVLTYATSRIFNFAQGSIGFVAAVVYFELHSGLHWPVPLAAFVSVGIVSPGLGWVLNKLLFSRLAAAGETAQTVTTISLLVALPALVLWILDLLINTAGLGLPSTVNAVAPPGLGPSPKEFFTVAGVTVDSDQLITFTAALLCAAGLWILLARTRTGLALRAVADRRELAALRGIEPERTSVLAWMLSSALAGLVGVLAAPLFGLDATNFTLLLLISATAAVFGRFQSVPVAFAAGLLLGVVQNLVAGYADFARDITGFRNAVPVLILFAGLVVLNRSRARVAGSISTDAPPPDYLADLPPWRRVAPWAGWSTVLVVYLVFFASDFWAGIIAQGLIMSVILLSVVVVTGFGGMVSFAQPAFVLAAGLTTGLLYARGLPLGVAALCGIAAAIVAGTLVALPAMRLGGTVLALATLALALAGEQVLFQLGWLNHDTLGWEMPGVSIGPLDLTDGRTMALFLLAVLALLTWLVRNLERSATGRAMLAVRAGPAAAATSGISAIRVKLVLFAVSAGLAGLGGILYSLFQGTIAASDFPATTSFFWFAVVVLFGVRRPGAAVVAGIVFSVMPQLLDEYVTSAPYLQSVLFGLGGIGLAQQPDGILAQFAQGRHARRRRTAPATDRPQVRTVSGAERIGRPVLRLEGVAAGYGDLPVLRGVDLSVMEGEVVAVVGANGAGKSTLCRVAAGLTPVTEGRIRLQEQDLTGAHAARIARLGVFTAPEGRGVFPDLTVEENLTTWLTHRDERDQVFDRFPRLAERRSTPAGVLSGGEQQILALAPVLVRPPLLVIADEPSLGLAPRITEEIFGVFAELRDQGVSLLLAEEKTDDVLRIADTVVFMRMGQIISITPRAEVDPEQLADAYLGLSALDEEPGERQVHR